MPTFGPVEAKFCPQCGRLLHMEHATTTIVEIDSRHFCSCAQADTATLSHTPMEKPLPGTLQKLYIPPTDS